MKSRTPLDSAYRCFAAVALISGAIGLVTAITNTTRFVNADWADFLIMASIGFGFPVIFVSGAVGLVLAVVHQEERPLLVMSAVSLLMLLAVGLVLADKLGGFAFRVWLVSSDAILIFYCVRWFRYSRKRTIGSQSADKQGPQTQLR